jgi:transcriptional pleiotropic repressor
MEETRRMNRLIANLRQLNALLQRTAGQAVSFREVAAELGSMLEANIWVFSQKGKLLGFGQNAPDSLLARLADNRLPGELNRLLLEVRKTEPDLSSGHASAYAMLSPHVRGKERMIVPIIGRKDRVGTLLVSRDGQAFGEGDVVLAEYGATIIGMEIIRGQVDEQESEARTRAAAQSAVASLSFSELEAVEQILQELESLEGLLVASKIADRAGITRSVIVNALRKLECAGILEARSLGMKGTYIKVINDKIFAEIGNTKIRTGV